MKVITIGRGTECNVVLEDAKVSRVHAQFIQDDTGNISVVDFDSTNGTFVNGKRISGKVTLSPGDDVRVGDTHLPWQNYLSVGTAEGFSQADDKKNNRTTLWVILAVLLSMLVSGGVVWLLSKQDTKQTKVDDVTNLVPDCNCDSTAIIIAEKKLALRNAQIAGDSAAIYSLESQIGDLSSSYNSSKNLIRDLKSNINAQDEIIGQLKSDTLLKYKKINVLKIEIDNKNNTIVQLQNDTISKSKEIKELNNRIAVLEEKLKNLGSNSLTQKKDTSNQKSGDSNKNNGLEGVKANSPNAL